MKIISTIDIIGELTDDLAYFVKDCKIFINKNIEFGEINITFEEIKERSITNDLNEPIDDVVIKHYYCRIKNSRYRFIDNSFFAIHYLRAEASKELEKFIINNKIKLVEERM